MKILALDKIVPGASEAAIHAELAAEARKAWELYTEDFIREMYFRTDRPGAVLILECADLDEARRGLDELPLVKAGLFDWDLIPLGPFVPLAGLFK